MILYVIYVRMKKWAAPDPRQIYCSLVGKPVVQRRIPILSNAR